MDQGQVLTSAAGATPATPTSGAPAGPWVVGAVALSFAALVLTLFAAHRKRVAKSPSSLKREPVQSPGSTRLALGLGLAILLGGGFSAAWGFSNAAFGFLFGAGLVLALADPVLGACLLVGVVTLRPWEVADTPAMSIMPKLAAGACVASWLARAARGQGLALLFSWPVRLFVGFAVWVVVSVLTNVYFEQALTEFTGGFMIASITFFLVVNILRTADDASLICSSFVIPVIGVVAQALITTAQALPGQRLEGNGMLGNSNDLAAVAVLALPLLVAPRLGLTRTERRQSRLAGLMTWGGTVLLLGGLWSSESRGAVLALFGGLAAYFVVRSRNPRRGALVAAGLLPFALGAVKLLQALRSADDIEGSTGSRMMYVMAGIKMAIQHPLMGVGFTNYPRFVDMFNTGGGEWGQRTAHNTWILALAETGVPGFCLLLALYGLTLREAWKVRGPWPALFPAMVSYGIAISFLSHTYLLFPYLLVAMVLVAGKTAGSVAAVDAVAEPMSRKSKTPVESAPAPSRRGRFSRAASHPGPTGTRTAPRIVFGRRSRT